LIEITGPSASGKTQLCLSAAASFAALDNRVVYVDTTGGFSATRIKQLHRGFFAEDAEKAVVEEHLDKTLNLIAVHKCHDVFSLLTLLSQLGEEASEDDNNPERATMGLLVIDSLSALLSPLLTKAHHQGYTIMATVAAMLRGLATTRKTAALYTNHTVSAGQDSLADDHGSNLKPALGTRWTAVPHRRIRLSKIPGTGWHSASIVYGVSAKPVKYRIGSNNIHGAPTQ
jgi:RAD51-like protein 3